MQVIIPVAGIGSRLRPHTHTQPKALIPVAGKPIIAHIVDYLVQAGLDEFTFIIGYLGDKIERFIHERYPELKSSFVIQTSGKGTAHAIWLAKDKINLNEPVLIAFGDSIVSLDIREFLASDKTILGVKKVEDPRLFGVAEIDGSGKIMSLVEKPLIPKSNLALVGLYHIRETALLMETLEEIVKNDLKTHGEYHLTDGLEMMRKRGVEMLVRPVDRWFDCGKKEVLLETNATLLRENSNHTEASERVVNTILVQPIYIAPTASVNNCILGPNVSVGENAILENSIIRNSIIGPYAHLEQAVLFDSLIGNDAHLQGQAQSLNLGDSAEIRFS